MRRRIVAIIMVALGGLGVGAAASSGAEGPPTTRPPQAVGPPDTRPIGPPDLPTEWRDEHKLADHLSGKDKSIGKDKK